MKKIMSLMLGLSLITGVAAFAQDKPADTTSTTKTKKSTKAKGKKKSTATTTTGSSVK